AGAASAATAPNKKPAMDQNPAFKAMGLPRLRLPSRNWLIFLSITGSIAGAITYDRWQTRRVKQKWCDLVSHLAEEPLSSHHMPRRLTIYLAAPPADGLRSAREHFTNYIKPILVAGGMDWDVVEGRREGDVRFKTAERVRRKRKRGGEGEVLSEEEREKAFVVDMLREKAGTTEYPGVAGDLVIGRHAWKEYLRGLHEGWLGPPDAPPKLEETGVVDELDSAAHRPGQASLGDAAVKGAVNVIEANTPGSAQSEDHPSDVSDAQKEEEEEKPKPRHPPPYILPSAYASAQLSPSTPETIGPSAPIRFPHILGIRNTPIRVYRFLNRRYLADAVGRDVAAAVLASSYRPYTHVAQKDEDSAPGVERTVPEQTQVLAHEEKEWWKTVREPRKEHEESVWIEEVVLDERLAARMRKFELSGEDEVRARRIA
ncbi:hypothetical protein BAUCODRAFT_49367, partial [Baudoinia panamericana UAMH 10762]